jgi:carbonic anhydrase
VRGRLNPPAAGFRFPGADPNEVHMVPNRIAPALGMLALAAACGGAARAQQGQPDWSYVGRSGQLVWGRLNPAYAACEKGRQQSPVDIRNTHRNRALQPLAFHYLAMKPTLVNTGNAIQLDFPPGSYMEAGGHRYDLFRIEFHHPGEVPVKGRLSDMSLEMLHRDAEGKMAIVAVRLNEGAANTVLAALWPVMPKKLGETAAVKDYVNAAALLPADRSYWTFPGSLSSPPCTEGVTWFVLEQQVEIARDQLRTFAALFPRNSRDPQPIHGRRIEEASF